MNNELLLSICIPTYNRASILKKSLKLLLDQIKGYENKIELLVSNNCSTDDTERVIMDYIEQGAPINYNCHEKNLGMDGNFVYCFQSARGKYVWILGDDDYLIEGAFKQIMNILQNGNYGLVHLKTKIENSNPFEIIADKVAFMDEISYWITFISTNIVRAKYVTHVDLKKYMGTYFTLVPVYLTAAVYGSKNAIIRFKTLDYAKDAISNGGYNIFEVFVTNYLKIIKEFRPQLSWIWYEKEKYRLCRYFIWSWMNTLLMNRNHGLHFSSKGWFNILFHKYWYEPYFYVLILLFYYKHIQR